MNDMHIDRAARRRLSEAENARDVRRRAILCLKSIERPSDAKLREIRHEYELISAAQLVYDHRE